MVKHLPLRIGIVAAVILVSLVYLYPPPGVRELLYGPASGTATARGMLPRTLNLGLDLQGGIHLVLGVDLDRALEAQTERMAVTLRGALERKGVAVRRVERQGTVEVAVELASPDTWTAAQGALGEFASLETAASHQAAGRLTLRLRPAEATALRDRRVVFLGAVLTQVSVLGLTMTFLPFFALPHTVGSLAVTLLTVLVVSRLLSGKKIPRDAVLGVVFSSSIALRILLTQKAGRVEAAEVENLLRGDILFVTPELFYMMLGVFAVAMPVYILFFKEFSYVAFDPEMASTQGYRTGFWDSLFYLLAGGAIAFSTHMVGDQYWYSACSFFPP